MDGDAINFILGYLQPVTGVGCTELGRALRATGEASLKCLGIDGNDHSLVWGPSSVDSNPQRIMVENILASEDLFSLNSSDSSPTYIGDDGRCSWIDVSAISVDLLERAIRWTVETDAGLGSDHALITWELLVQPHSSKSH